MRMSAPLALAALLLAAATVTAQAPPKASTTNKVSGAIVALTDDTITIEKKKERWEIARTAETKTAGDLKVGQKVTVTYRMTATNIEAKAADAKKGEKK